MSDDAFPNDSIEAQKQIDGLEKEAKFYVLVAGLATLSIFGYALLRKVPFGAALASTNHEYLQAVVLFSYYYLWVAGCYFDIGLQKIAYLTAPNEQKIRLDSIISVVLLIAIGIIIYLVKDHELYFSVAIFLLVIFNIAGWLHIVSRISPIIEKSYRIYDLHMEFFGKEALVWVEWFMTGFWQRIRFSIMILVAGIMILASLFLEVREITASSIHFISFSNIPLMTANNIAIDVLFLCFVVIAEGWIWLLRAFVKMSLYVIAALRRTYRLYPRHRTIAE